MAINFTITSERKQDAIQISHLLEASFGPGRFVRAAYRLREGRAPTSALSLVARIEDDNLIIGVVRFWPIAIADKRALLLGPIAVSAQHRGHGIARALIERGCERAKSQKHHLVILVGDLDYYADSHFQQARGQIIMPGPVNPLRILVRPLVKGADDNLSGEARALHPAATRFCGYESVMIDE